MNRCHLVLTAGLALAASPAQSVEVPHNPASLPAGVTSYPWDLVGSGGRAMYFYPGQGFVAQGVTFPILVRALECFTDSPVAGVATYPNLTIEMSTGPVGLTSSYAMTSFAANHGGDRTAVWNGQLTTELPDPLGRFVTVPLSPGFLFDPGAGDLVVDYAQDGAAATGTGTRAYGPSGSPGLATVGARIYHPTLPTAAAPVGQNPYFALQTRLQYIPAAGLNPAFDTSSATGPAPLLVQFTDQTYTSDPNGVMAWAWDLDGDGTVDSTAQNPTFTYAQCGTYDVELQVTDAVHGTQTLRRVGLVHIDPLIPAFDTTALGGSTVQFNDGSTGATAWAWDFDNDGVVDSTAQNPQHTFASAGRHPVSLSVTNSCRAESLTQTISTFSSLTTTSAGGNGLPDPGAANLMDVQVTNPSGIVITGLDVSAWSADPNGTVDVFVSADSHLTVGQDPAAWRLVASANASLTGGAGSLDFVDIPDVFLPVGTFGLAIRTSAGVSYSDTGGGPATFANGDLTLTTGAAQTALFSTPPFADRTWNGTLYYDGFKLGGYGFVGAGCPGAGGVPAVTAAPGTVPTIGSTLVLDVTGMPAGGGVAVMVLGFQNTAWNGTPLPVDLSPFGLTGCLGRVDPFDTFLLLHSNGSAQWSLPIPAVPGFVGALLFQQVLVLDSTAPNPIGAIMSDAGGGRVGS